MEKVFQISSWTVEKRRYIAKGLWWSFFKDNVIYAYVKNEGSGSTRLKVKGAEFNGDKLRLFMERIYSGEGTYDMATRICLFEIKRDNIKNTKAIEAIIIDK